MVNWQRIDNVLLDMDGTLLDLSFDNYFWLEFLPQKISIRKDISLEDAIEIVRSLSESTYGSLLW